MVDQEYLQDISVPKNGQITWDQFKNKANLISKLNVASISSELYAKHEILAHISESENSNFLYVAPSLIASDENVDYFFNSLDEALKSKLDLKLLKYIISSIFNIV